MKLISSFLLGATLVLIFEPFNFWLLGFLLPISFYFLIRKENIKNSFILGSFFGLGLWLFGIFWIENSIYFYGGANRISSYFLIICLSVFLSLLSGTFFSIFSFCKTKTDFDILFLFPSVWVSLEFLREFVFSGFPWFYLGYTTLDNFFVSGFVPIIGVFGMSFILIFIPAAIYVSYKSFFKEYKYKIKTSYISILFLILFSSFMTYQVDWTKEKEKVNVVIIQPNISIDEKWSLAGELESIDLFKAKIKEHSLKAENKEILSIIFWPEVFFPGLLSKYKDIIDELERQSTKSNLASIFGALSISKRDNKGINNSLVSFGKASGKFDKQKLVPFGEYVPHPIFNSFFNFFNFDRPNIVSSNENILIKSKSLKISSAICYEIAFQDIFLEHSKESNILFNASNDNWFGNTIGPYQHLQIARYRAAENRKPLIRSTSTGISALIDRFGNIVERTELDIKKQNILDSVEIESIIFSRSGYPPYVAMGKLPSIFFILFVIFGTFLTKIFRK